MLAVLLAVWMALPAAAAEAGIPVAEEYEPELSYEEVTMEIRTRTEAKEVTVLSCPELAGEVVELVNAERRKAGVPEVAPDEKLGDAVLLRAAETTVSFGHTRPDGSKWHTVSDRANGENIAYGQDTGEWVMERWMDSREHRKNILNKHFSRIAVACVKIDGIHYWVQLFGWGD